MKLVRAGLHIAGCDIASRAGALIETYPELSNQATGGIASRAGALIETNGVLHRHAERRIASRAGALIETELQINPYKGCTIALPAGAPIETRFIGSGSASSVSHSLRVRRLKLRLMRPLARFPHLVMVFVKRFESLAKLFNGFHLLARVARINKISLQDFTPFFS